MSSFICHSQADGWKWCKRIGSSCVTSWWFTFKTCVIQNSIFSRLANTQNLLSRWKAVSRSNLIESLVWRFRVAQTNPSDSHSCADEQLCESVGFSSAQPCSVRLTTLLNSLCSPLARPMVSWAALGMSRFQTPNVSCWTCGKFAFNLFPRATQNWTCYFI